MTAQNEILFTAVLHGNDEVAKMMINEGANTNYAQKNRKTVLHYASEQGHAGVVKLLLDAGSFINQKTSEYYTPLHYASQNGHVDVVELLLEKHALMNGHTNSGFSPLHLASMHGYSSVVEILLKAGAFLHITTTTSNKMTPLQVAISNGKLDVVKLLLIYGAEGGNAALLVASERRKDLEYESIFGHPPMNSDERWQEKHGNQKKALKKYRNRVGSRRPDDTVRQDLNIAIEIHNYLLTHKKKKQKKHAKSTNSHK